MHTGVLQWITYLKTYGCITGWGLITSLQGTNFCLHNKVNVARTFVVARFCVKKHWRDEYSELPDRMGTQPETVLKPPTTYIARKVVSRLDGFPQSGNTAGLLKQICVSYFDKQSVRPISWWAGFVTPERCNSLLCPWIYQMLYKHK